MNREQRDRLDDIKEEVRVAARALHDHDLSACCGRLIDAMLQLSLFLETLER